MAIKIDIPSYLQPYTNDIPLVSVAGQTVGECLNQLMQQYPDVEKMLLAKDGKLLDYVNIYVNNEDAYPEELAKPLQEGDTINILYLIGGG